MLELNDLKKIFMLESLEVNCFLLFLKLCLLPWIQKKWAPDLLEKLQGCRIQAGQYSKHIRCNSERNYNELSSTCHNVSERKNFRRHNSPRGPTSNPAPPMILEWIEHNQERTYEHMLQSESNVSLGRLNFHDQYREMRMDIDNMSYEELLELVEKMGSVSTSLTDEALIKYLKRSNFKRRHSLFGIIDCVEDVNIRSICLVFEPKINELQMSFICSTRSSR